MFISKPVLAVVGVILIAFLIKVVSFISFLVWKIGSLLNFWEWVVVLMVTLIVSYTWTIKKKMEE
jgi:hypothetical protein